MTLDDALQDFLLALGADGRTETTVTWYASILSPFVASFGERPIDTITTKELRQYIVSLRSRTQRYVNAKQKPTEAGGLSDASVTSHITALHALWNWLALELDLPKNPMSRIRRPRQRNPQPKALQSADFIKLFEATGDDDAGCRDRAILTFLADTGCRRGGLVTLQVSNLHLADRRAVVFEKGAVSRVVVFTFYTAQTLDRWLKVRPSHSDAVFTSMNTGHGLSESGFNQVLKRLKQRTDVRGRVNPHSFRHNFAREYLRNGGDLATLARLLGHKNINTTASYYAVFDSEELAALHEKHSPLSSLLRDGNLLPLETDAQ